MISMVVSKSSRLLHFPQYLASCHINDRLFINIFLEVNSGGEHRMSRDDYNYHQGMIIKDGGKRNCIRKERVFMDFNVLDILEAESAWQTDLKLF